MEGVAEKIVTSKVLPSAISTDVLSGSERSVMSENISTITTGLENNREVKSAFSSQDEGAAGFSTSMTCFPSVGANKNNTAVIAEPDYPATGSPPADLMVINTNGFNPLQHAALRGNPG